MSSRGLARYIALGTAGLAFGYIARALLIGAGPSIFLGYASFNIFIKALSMNITFVLLIALLKSEVKDALLFTAFFTSALRLVGPPCALLAGAPHILLELLGFAASAGGRLVLGLTAIVSAALAEGFLFPALIQFVC